MAHRGNPLINVPALAAFPSLCLFPCPPGKALRFYTTCKPMSEPALFPRLLQKTQDRRLRDKGPITIHGCSSRQRISIFLHHIPQTSAPTG